MTTQSLPHQATASIGLSWALFYASIKLAVFPVQFVFENGACSCGNTACSRIGKHPMTLNGFKDATTEENTVRYYFEGEPEANVGIRCGSESGIVVLDVDVKSGGPASLSELVAEHGALPVTPRVRTGGGGTHYYFRHPGAGMVIPNRQGMRPGLDLRGDGGYVVAPPSNHTEAVYEFEAGQGLGDVQLAAMPQWLLALALVEAAAHAPSGVPAPSNDGQSIPSGERNASLFALACAMRAKGMSRSGIDAAVRAENVARCQPPLGEGEVAKIVSATMKYPAGVAPRGRMVSALPRDEVVQQTKAAFESAADPKVSTEAVSFVVQGLVAERGITLITGKPKTSGKSTLVAHMLAKIVEGQHFIGLPVQRTPVVVLTEERTTFVELLRRSGLMGRDDVRFLRWDPSRDATFSEQMMAAKSVAKDIGAQLIIVDTLAQFIGLRGDAENDPGSVLDGVKPLQDAAKDGYAVVVVHHEKKSGGGVGDSSRGSTAITGAVDIILSVSRPEGQTSPKVRVIHTLSRYPATPDVLFVELTEHGYERRDEAGVVTAAVEKVLLDAAPDGEANAASITALIAGAVPAIKESTARKVANQLLADGKLLRKGDGKKGSPHLFWRAQQVSFRTTPSPGEAESNPGPSAQPELAH